MACNCGTVSETTGDIVPVNDGCDCGCCTPSDELDRHMRLERVVMELDKRLRKLEATSH